jgi:hypothetical protein
MMAHAEGRNWSLFNKTRVHKCVLVVIGGILQIFFLFDIPTGGFRIKLIDFCFKFCVLCKTLQLTCLRVCSVVLVFCDCDG